jgi:hypothetical protein
MFGEQYSLFSGRAKPKPVCVLYTHELM